jgi:hypothetical protein
MKPRHAAACARCGNEGRPRQLNEFLQHDENEPLIVLCNRCVHALKFADASTWKWFRKHRNRTSQDKSELVTQPRSRLWVGI